MRWGVEGRCVCFFFCQAEEGIRDLLRSRGLGDVNKRQMWPSPESRSLGWACEARGADSRTRLNRTFSERLRVEGNRELAALVLAFAIFGLSTLVWVVLLKRLRAWGRALEAEMAQRREAEGRLRRAQPMEAPGRVAAGDSPHLKNNLGGVSGLSL